MEMMKLKAQKGVLVRDPVTMKPLSEKGEEKPVTPYWMRRVSEGSAMMMAAAKESK